MKRMMAVLMLLIFLLSGCAGTGKEQVSSPQEDRQTQETAPEPVGEPEAEPVTEPVAQEPPQTPATAEQAESDALAAQAAAVYAAITEGVFTIWVTEPDGTITTLEVIPGVNDWNVEGRENTFAYTYQWAEATYEDWQDQWMAEDCGTMVTLAAPEEMSLACCTGGDVVEVADRGTPIYLRAVNPRAGTEPFEWNLCGMMLNVIVADALGHEMWNVTADGSLHPRMAAEQMLEQIAENYRTAPDWTPWKPLDARAGGTDVFDIYWGEPQEFCCGMGLRLKFDDYMGERANRWQAGAGLAEPDAEGYCGYGAEVYIRKNETGDWQYVERGSGGYSVNPQNTEKKPRLEWLVELFCLTEGFTHDWRTPCQILDLPEEELAALPALLDQLTEAEARELCAVLGDCLREITEHG